MMALAILCAVTVRAQSAPAEMVFDTLKYRVFSGRVVDADNNRSLPFAAVYL